ncbi:MAG: hypothetical protein EOP53_02835 [Sphingobacteriales bacterium]|nr:MAG: hypothetical protein EOP53_02835 [Sphingobacteriales bacterium]
MMKQIVLFLLILTGLYACGDENKTKADEYFKSGEQKIVAQDFAGAEADFTQAIALDPERYTPYHGRGEVRLFLGKQQEGLDDLKKAMELMKKTQDMDDPQYQNAYLAIKTKYETSGGN